MNVIERLLFEPSGGMFREFEGLTCHFEPKDLALYRKLLPEPFAMPDQPVVTIFAADHIRVVPWPMTRYQEWSVLLKSKWKGEEAWYSYTMPVTRWVPMVGGRYLGYPKYVIDEVALVKSGEIRLATAKNKGAVQLALEFCPGITRPLAPYEKELMENESFFKGNSHQLVPPGRGPRAQKIVLCHLIQPMWTPVPGMIQVRVDQSELWAGLIPDEAVFPGTYNHFTGGINLMTESKS